MRKGFVHSNANGGCLVGPRCTKISGFFLRKKTKINNSANRCTTFKIYTTKKNTFGRTECVIFLFKKANVTKSLFEDYVRRIRITSRANSSHKNENLIKNGSVLNSRWQRGPREKKRSIFRVAVSIPLSIERILIANANSLLLIKLLVTKRSDKIDHSQAYRNTVEISFSMQ